MAVVLLHAAPALALEAIVLEAEEVEIAGLRATDVALRLDLPDPEGARLTVSAARIAGKALPAPVERFVLSCPEPVVREPLFACPRARIAARLGGVGALDLRAGGELRTDSGKGRVDVAPFALAGGKLGLAAQFDRRAWTLQGRGEGCAIPAVRTLAAQWYELPKEITLDGRLAASFRASGRTAGGSRGGSALSLRADARLTDVNLSNAEGTVVAENVDAAIGLTATLARPSMRRPVFELRIDSAKGQALAGPVLLDFQANPLVLVARGVLEGAAGRDPARTFVIEDARLAQEGLARAQATARVALGEEPALRQARVTIEELRFPAAYTSFLQIALAATDFGALDSSGSVSGDVEIENGAVARANLTLRDIDLTDARRKFFMVDVAGELHWATDPAASPAPSFLQWNYGGAYGLSGQAARLEFLARGRGFELTRPARVPVFDGALAVRALAMRNLGLQNVELDFEADIEPISMPLLSEAFGWPELAGSLGGRIPAVQYRNKVLSIAGDVEAQVFGGSIVGSGFRLQDPLGPWPRMFADVRARNLDLELVTRTFSIGTITGRLEGHVLGLELFNWSPVAFDAVLRTPPGDRSARRISAKAVGNLSNIGGGGGGVVQALQSGLLRFFDEYRYDRLGIRCRLREDVCIMGGIEPAGIGYYIVKGSGVPRIDIIGNAGRVNWPQLVSQISASMQSEGVLVR